MDDVVRELLTKMAVEDLKRQLGNAPYLNPIRNKKKRIFISFAVEDKFARDNLVFQAKQDHTPFDFVDMSVKEIWSSEWKRKCRERIKGCDGVVVFISKNTPKASGACWEIKCAKEEGIPIQAFWVHKDEQREIPAELGKVSVKIWNWDNIKSFIDSV